MKEEQVRTELAANSIGLLGVLMQGIATIAPAFAIVSTFVFTVGLAGLAAPLAYLIAGAILLPLALAVNQLAKAFPSAGGWYTWIARSLHPRAGFFAGWYMTLWVIDRSSTSSFRSFRRWPCSTSDTNRWSRCPIPQRAMLSSFSLLTPLSAARSSLT